MAKSKILIAGRPNSGKGSIEEKIIEKHPELFELYSVGDKLREHRKNGTEIGQKAWEYMKKGEIVPDELVVEMVMDDIMRAQKNLLIDGFPRTEGQLDAMIKANMRPDAILLIDITPEEAIVRSLNRRVCPNCGATYTVEGGYNPPKKCVGVCDNCGTTLTIRDDDKPEVSSNRQRVYITQTEPAIYRAMNTFEAGCYCKIINNMDSTGFEQVEKALTEHGLITKMPEL